MALFTDKRELERQASRVPFSQAKGFNKFGMALMGYNADGTQNTWGNVAEAVSAFVPVGGQFNNWVRRSVAKDLAKGTDAVDVFEGTKDEFVQSQINNFGFGLNVAKTVATIVAGAAGAAGTGAGGAQAAEAIDFGGGATSIDAANALKAEEIDFGANFGISSEGTVNGTGTSSKFMDMFSKAKGEQGSENIMQKLIKKSENSDVSGILKNVNNIYNSKNSEGGNPVENISNEEGYGSNQSMEGKRSSKENIDITKALGGGGLIQSGFQAYAGMKNLDDAENTELKALMGRTTRSKFSYL